MIIAYWFIGGNLKRTRQEMEHRERLHQLVGVNSLPSPLNLAEALLIQVLYVGNDVGIPRYEVQRVLNIAWVIAWPRRPRPDLVYNTQMYICLDIYVVIPISWM